MPGKDFICSGKLLLNVPPPVSSQVVAVWEFVQNIYMKDKMKRCYRCKIDKKHKDFFVSKTSRDGLKTYCKTCTVEYNSSYGSQHKKNKYKTDESFREKKKKEVRDRRKKSPEKMRARSVFSKHVVAGKIIRPKVCSHCKRSDKKRIEGHHEDYIKPFDVIWLCTSCHQKLHKNPSYRE